MKIGFIGAGNMGYALLQAAMSGEDNDILVYDKDEKKAKSVASHTGATFAEAGVIASECDYVFLGVKPNIIPCVIGEIEDYIGENTTLVSMAAGVKIDSIEKMISKDGVPIIRIMPNLAVSIGSGTILWCNNTAARERTEAFIEAMGAAGVFAEIDESKMDAGSAISGCGPAFAYMFIAALADGGVACGLTREAALEYASQVLIGAARMVQETGRHPAELKDEVCSPGGSTIAGVLALEDGAFRATVSSAVKASYKKTRELGK
jgi:pyrroline-5-carboxylate reductase